MNKNLDCKALLIITQRQLFFEIDGLFFVFFGNRQGDDSRLEF